MSDKIEEIRKRITFADENKSVIRPTGFSWTIPGWQAHNDRATLLAEVDRQRADNERLRAALEYMVNVCPAIDPDGDRAHEQARKALESKP